MYLQILRMISIEKTTTFAIKKYGYMKEKSLYRFNILLLVVSLLVAISSLLLECIAGQPFLTLGFTVWVWGHIILGVLCLLLLFYHLYLHWGRIGKWFSKIKTQNAKSIKWLAILSLITFLSGLIVAVIFWLTPGHHTLGGIHGKFGLVLIVFTLFHVWKRLRWFKNRRCGKAFIPAIDQGKCIACSKCVKRCPAQVFARHNKQISVYQPLFCLQCMKCVSLCPKQAIS